mgnify:CR=1 FL=1
MGLLNTTFSFIAVIISGIIVALGLVWQLWARKNIRDFWDAFLTAINFILYYLFILALFVVEWGDSKPYIEITLVTLTGYGVIAFIRRKRNKHTDGVTDRSKNIPANH